MALRAEAGSESNSAPGRSKRRALCSYIAIPRETTAAVDPGLRRCPRSHSRRPTSRRASHSDPVTPVVIALAVILAAAKVGGHLAAKWVSQRS